MLAIIARFRLTLLALAVAVVIGTAVFWVAPPPAGGKPPSLSMALFAGWMALLDQPFYAVPHTWYLGLVEAVYPVVGFLLIGEGIVRLSLLVISKQQGEREWMRVMAGVQRDHIVLCGLGHLGLRVLQELVKNNIGVVVLEKHKDTRQMTHAKELGVSVLIRDMKEDQALIDAGIQHARAVIICTNDEMANLEVALDSRRLNPGIRVVMRSFDQQIAEKIAGAMSIDAPFSSATLAAPMVAAMAMGGQVLASYLINGVSHVTAELTIDSGSALTGRSVVEIEAAQQVRVLSRSSNEGLVRTGEKLVVHTASANLAALLTAAKRV